MTPADDRQDLLGVYLWGSAARPWAWGTHDCCAFAAGAVRFMGGPDYLSGFRYATESDAAKLLRQNPLRGRIRDVIGPPLGGVPQRGDVVVVTMEGQDTAGVALSDRLGVFASAPGWRIVVLTPFMATLDVWRWQED